MEPVGPEEPRTYWLRRALVGGVVLVVVIAVVALVAALTGGDDGNTAEPAPPTGPSLQPAGTPTPTTSPSKSEASDEPGASDKSSASDKPGASDKSSASDKATSSGKPSGSKKSSSKSSSKSPAKPAACKPDDLRTTLTGPRTVKPGKDITFQAGVINGGSTTCTFTLDPKAYELRVYSGSDKIWTTADCTKWQPKVEATLKPQADVTWKVKWTVQRSKDCKLVENELKPGTYAANSLVKGAPPAQLVMQLR